MTFLFLFLTSAAITLGVTPALRELFRSLGWVDHPDRRRKLHASPIPRLGGFPISIAFFSSLLLLRFVHAMVPSIFSMAEAFRLQQKQIDHLVLPSLLILAIGAWDDIRGASPVLKITAQVAAGYWLFIQGISISHIGVPGTSGIYLGWTSLPVSILWVVGITNALNLVDGLDGLASGVAFFAATTMFVVAIISHNSVLAILTASLSGATLAFLRFNFNPATVFLGDSGSMFLGFLLSAFAMIWSSKAPTLVAVVAPLFALGLPIAEVGISVFRRFVRGQPIFGADREHIHHRLLDQGFTTRKAVLLLYGVCALLGITSLLLANWWTRDTGLVLLVLVAGGWLGIQQLGYHEFGEVGDSIRRGLFQQRRVINMHVRLRNLGDILARVSEWSELLEVLRELGGELGFHEVVLDLAGRDLPPEVARHQQLSCVAGTEPESGRPWRLTIPIGARPDDDCQIVFSRSVAAGATNYMISVLVESLSATLPTTLDRLLAEQPRAAAPALNDPLSSAGKPRPSISPST